MTQDKSPWDIEREILSPIGEEPSPQSPSAKEWMSPTASPALSVTRPNVDLAQAHQDRRSHRGMREFIAVWLIALLFLIISLAFTAVFLDDDPTMLDKRFQHLKSLLDVIIGPVSTLLSSAIGFYFGMQVNNGRTTDEKSDT